MICTALIVSVMNPFLIIFLLSNGFEGKQLGTIAKLIKSKDVRGVSRDIFYARHGSYDTVRQLLLRQSL